MKIHNGAFLALLLMLPSGIALASARDDVMSGSARCALIQDGRNWLNCYYGAAQPMRAELGLPPAAPAQVNLVPPRTSVTTAAPALGGARDLVMSGSARCAAIDNNRVWLDCYYGAAQPMRAELGMSPAPPAQTGLIAMPSRPQQVAASTPPPREKGFFSTLLGREKLIQNMPVTSYRFNETGSLVVTLGNGEVWQQLTSDSAVARWRKPASSYRASITTASLGSRILTVVGDANVYKVRQIDPN